MAINILLVDDDSIQGGTRKSILERVGHSVTVSQSGQDALDFLQLKESYSVRLILTDHQMPAMSGPEFVRNLRKAGCLLPVVVLSGYADIEDEYDGLSVTCRVKPFPPDQLISLVQYLLDASERRTA
jgi:CheY-like chemotaxis protein